MGHERQINILLGLGKAAQVTDLTARRAGAQWNTDPEGEMEQQGQCQRNEMQNDFASPSQGSITCL